MVVGAYNVVSYKKMSTDYVLLSMQCEIAILHASNIFCTVF